MKISSILLSAILISVNSFALDLQAVFDNQKKSTFPDTSELQIRTTFEIPGLTSQKIDAVVINAGPTKSVTTIKSSAMQMKIVQNNGRMKVTDLKTGKALPAQNIPQQNITDISKQMGSPEDYNVPEKSGTLWKITPKDATKPTLYYSSKVQRVVKMTAIVNSAETETEFEYCDNTCRLPGTLRKTTITTKLNDGNSSKVVIEILQARQHHSLPKKLFDLE